MAVKRPIATFLAKCSIHKMPVDLKKRKEIAQSFGATKRMDTQLVRRHRKIFWLRQLQSERLQLRQSFNDTETTFPRPVYSQPQKKRKTLASTTHRLQPTGAGVSDRHVWP
jgi:hypothetical protein